MNLEEALIVIRESKISQTVFAAGNNIGAEEAKALAKQLKDSTVSHTIDLRRNDIGDQGAKDLAEQLKETQFPSYITMEDIKIEEMMRGNDAILAIYIPRAFKLKIEETFGTSFPALGQESGLIEPLKKIIIEYIGGKEVSHINLQYLQQHRIKYFEKHKEVKITAAQANYESVMPQSILDIGSMDWLATFMLLTENVASLLPKELKNKVSEYVDINYLQYGVELALGLGAAYLGYKSGISAWNLPLKRALIFCAKGVMVDSLVTNMESVTEMVAEYTYGYIGEKEQSLILEIVLGVGMLSPAPMMTIGIMGLKGVSDYLDIEKQQIIGKLGGGLLGFIGAYYAGMGTYYQYAASIIGGAYIGEVLVDIKNIAVYGTEFISGIYWQERADIHSAAFELVNEVPSVKKEGCLEQYKTAAEQYKTDNTVVDFGNAKEGAEYLYYADKNAYGKKCADDNNKIPGDKDQFNAWKGFIKTPAADDTKIPSSIPIDGKDAKLRDTFGPSNTFSVQKKGKMVFKEQLKDNLSTNTNYFKEAACEKFKLDGSTEQKACNDFNLYTAAQEHYCVQESDTNSTLYKAVCGIEEALDSYEFGKLHEIQWNSQSSGETSHQW